MRLRAEDDADVTVLSSFLQDAVVTMRDMAYLPSSKRFAMVVSRFMWETVGDGGTDGDGAADYHRVTTGVHFDNVLSAVTRNLPRAGSDRALELLAIHSQPAQDGAATLTLIFSGGASVRLSVECIDCQAQDMGEPRPARHKPNHSVTDDVRFR